MDNDDIDASDNPRKEPGLLEVLARRQQEVQDLFDAIRGENDKSFIQGIILEYPDIENLIVVTLVLVQLSHTPDREITQNDVVWAMEFIDHLDTLGKQLCPKGSIVRG